MTEKFDYIKFAKEMARQSAELVPKEISKQDKVFVCDIVEEYSKMAGEGFKSLNKYSDEIQLLGTQIIAEWTFNRAVSIINDGLPDEYRYQILQNIAFVIFETLEKGFDKNLETDVLLELVEKQVMEQYDKSINKFSDKEQPIEGIETSIDDYLIDDETQEETETFDDNKFYFSATKKVFEKNDYVGAIEDYSKHIELKPNDGAAYYDRAYCKSLLGDIEGAEEDYAKAIQISPDNKHIYYSRGKYRLKNKDFYGAIDDFTKMIELSNFDGDVFEACMHRADARFQLQDYQGALDDLNKCVELDSDTVYKEELYTNRGKCKERLGDIEGAEEDFKKAGE